MKLLYLVILVALASCSSHKTMMTRNTFDDVQIGETVEELESKVGQPYAIRSKGEGKKEYEYIERVNVSGESVYQNHYYVIVTDGKVVGKRTGKEKVPAYDLIYEDDPNDIVQY